MCFVPVRDATVSKTSLTARQMTPGSSGVPSIVNVFPDPVCPYANTVALVPATVGAKPFVAEPLGQQRRRRYQSGIGGRMSTYHQVLDRSRLSQRLRTPLHSCCPAGTRGLPSTDATSVRRSTRNASILRPLTVGVHNFAEHTVFEHASLVVLPVNHGGILRPTMQPMITHHHTTTAILRSDDTYMVLVLVQRTDPHGHDDVVTGLRIGA